jgi:hypothetical protein
MMSIVASSVYIVVFTDSSQQMWHHFWQSVPVVVGLAAIFLIFNFIENRGPLPLVLRQGVWIAILVSYACVCVVIGFLMFSPLAPPGHAGYLLIRMAATLPIPIFAWRWLQQSKTANQSSEPMLSSGTSPAEQEPRLP